MSPNASRSGGSNRGPLAETKKSPIGSGLSTPHNNHDDETTNGGLSRPLLGLLHCTKFRFPFTPHTTPGSKPAVVLYSFLLHRPASACTTCLIVGLRLFLVCSGISTPQLLQPIIFFRPDRVSLDREQHASTPTTKSSRARLTNTMPLFTTSTSGQEDSSSLKRSHDQFREEVPPPSSFDDSECRIF